MRFTAKMPSRFKGFTAIQTTIALAMKFTGTPRNNLPGCEHVITKKILVKTH